MLQMIEDPELPPPSYNKERRRSSCSRGRDPDEILRNLKAVKGELGRTMSLSGDKRMMKREYLMFYKFTTRYCRLFKKLHYL